MNHAELTIKRVNDELNDLMELLRNQIHYENDIDGEQINHVFDSLRLELRDSEGHSLFTPLEKEVLFSLADYLHNAISAAKNEIPDYVE